ncbi:MAG: Rpn family recombination-promoting nuclease/putative transposase [Desulfobacterales bacterium]|nr:Rpn family recombination-promoting nuclease/putative transposase [Desulfobacterales bacterium]
MKHNIDPTIDCVFKALLGDEVNKNLLIHFLNAVMKPKKNEEIVKVTILNPYNEKEFLSDKLSIVDVKACDHVGRTFQIEIQLSIHSGLKSRIVYGWSDIYSSQLKEGQSYSQLKPVITIWLMTEDLFPEKEGFYYHFRLLDAANNVFLNEDCSIHILDLKKFNKSVIANEMERWMLFFKDAKNIDYENPPNFMNTEEMRQAMETLKRFSEKEKEYFLYQSRMNYLRVQKTIEEDMEKLRRDMARLKLEKEAIEQKKEAIEQEKEAIEQEKEAIEQEKEAIEQEKEAIEQERKLALIREQEAKAKEQEALQRERTLIEKLKSMGINPD